MGIVSAIGNNAAETLSSLLRQQTGIRPLRHLRTSHTDIPAGEVQLTNAAMARRLGIGSDAAVTRTSLMGMMAAGEALRQAHVDAEAMSRAAFVGGTTVGGMDMSEQFYGDFLANDSRNAYITQHDCGASTESIANHFGRFATVATLSTACSSAANAIVAGANMLRAGECDMAVVGGSECLTRFHLNGFNSLMLLDSEPCRPYDATRAGITLGEGAAFLVIETLNAAIRRGATPIAVLEGAANTCDAFHQTASSPDGQGAYLAMRGAIADAGITPADIDYVNAHGTATPNNDSSESQALVRIFGADAMPPVSSTKSYTGHTTSASGSIEAVICILAMQHQFLPVNLGWSQPAPDCIVPTTDSRPPRPLRHVLCNSFGFGGNTTSLVIGQPPADGATHATPTTTGSTTRSHAHTPIYITAAEQVSIQGTLTEEWLTAPTTHCEPCACATNVETRRWLNATEARRLGKLHKRAIATALTAMEHSGTELPDAIITGTGLGCMANTEALLTHLCEAGEASCHPTTFMQSTHNTIGSLIAIHTKSHGYNATYAHRTTSFDCALADAWRLLQLGKIHTALVGGHDELTPTTFRLLAKTGYLGNPGQTAGETAVSIMLDSRATHRSLCRIADVRRVFRPSAAELRHIASGMGHIDAVATGIFGQSPLDAAMEQCTGHLFPGVPLLRYKNVFGDGFTAFAFALYAAAHILKTQRLPEAMLVDATRRPAKLQRLLAINRTPSGNNFTFVVLERADTPTSTTPPSPCGHSCL